MKKKMEFMVGMELRDEELAFSDVKDHLEKRPSFEFPTRTFQLRKDFGHRVNIIFIARESLNTNRQLLTTFSIQF